MGSAIFLLVSPSTRLHMRLPLTGVSSVLFPNYGCNSWYT
jgi:hypothetical protein